MTTSGTSTPAAGNSRGVSPIPARWPSRGVSAEVNGASSGNGNSRPVGGLLASGWSSPVGVGSGGFTNGWESGWMSSWSTLQGLASSVLGGTGDDTSGATDRGGSLGRKGKGKVKEKPRSSSRTKIPDTWGPETHLKKKPDLGIGMGGDDERDAKLRAKKLAGVLEGRDMSSKTWDTNGNFKRRTSSDDQRPGSSQEDDQALVYIHKVQPNDTLQGVVLRYSCKPDVFRKANRFWPNDSIQTRKQVILPIDACTVKGRPCDPPNGDSTQYGVDLLAPTPLEEDPHFSSLSNPEPSAERPEDSENPWVHVRWVLIDSSPNSKPVEIARMPRKTLGYFPPRRRKSQTTLSTVSTPRGSTDLSQSSNPGTPSRRESSLSSRPNPASTAIGSYFPPPTSAPSTRPRRESVGEAADRLGWMRGPGGVGTLGPKIRKPGPANDGLNSWARKHVPGLAIDGLHSTSVLGAESAHFGFTDRERDELGTIAETPSGLGAVTPVGSAGTGLGLENAAAAIEGWVRRLAVNKGPGTPKGGGRVESQDLIELLDGAGSDDGRGFELSPGRVRTGTPVGGTGREDLDAVVRGRASAWTKGGKSD